MSECPNVRTSEQSEGCLLLPGAAATAKRDARCCVDRGGRRARERRVATKTTISISISISTEARCACDRRRARAKTTKNPRARDGRGRYAATRGGATRDGRRTATGGRERANDGTRTRYRGFLAKMESTKMDAEALREKLVAVREKTQEAMKKIEVPKVEDLRMLIEDIRQEQTEAKYHPDRRRLESVADFFAYTEEEGDSRNRIESKRARGDATLTLPMTDW